MDRGRSSKERVVIYNRCSTEELTQVKALEVQVAESLEIAERKGWTVVEQFIEPKSGTESEHRYEYQKLFNSLSSKEYDIVMVKSQDRLMRSDLDWNLFVKELLINNKQLYFYIDNKFYHHETDYLLYGFTSKMNEGYSIELSKKIKNAHARRQQNKSGLNISRPMFGWDKIGTNQYVINEKEAGAIRDAFEMVRAGMGFHTIAKIMHERGYRSKGTTGNKSLKGGMIAPTWWRKNCILDPKMHGEFVMHRDEKNFFTKQRVKIPKEDWIHYENALPPIVSKEYQEETIAMLKAREYKAPNANRMLVGKHLYSRKIVCRHCGCYFYRSKIKSGLDGALTNWKCAEQSQFGRDHCNNIIVEEEVLKEHMDREIQTKYDKLFCSDYNIIDKVMKYIKQAVTDDSNKKKLENLKEELGKQIHKKEILFEKLMNETISDSDFQFFNQKLEKQIEELEVSISDLEKQELLYGNYEKRVAEIKGALQNGTIERNAILQELEKMITVVEVSPASEVTVRFDKEKLTGLFGLYYAADMLNDIEDSIYELKFTYHRENKLDRKRRITNEKVIDTFRENPGITIAECATMLGEKYSYIYTSITQLRKEGHLEYKRLAFEHEGIWIVKDTSNS